MPIDHLFCENRRTGGRIGEDGLMALLHILLPEVAQKFFTLIGQATCGVALFAMGLLLSGQTFHVSIPSLANVTFKNLLQPAVMWGFALLLGVAGLSRREMTCSARCRPLR